MLNKKKLHFWQLVLTFGAITVLALAASYGYNRTQQTNMMGLSMGNMMSSMHLKNITVNDLIRQQEQVEAATGQDSMASHHNNGNGFLKTIHILTTASIIILLPFIVAGTVFLAIIWIK